jgi:hypothetical protein
MTSFSSLRCRCMERHRCRRQAWTLGWSITVVVVAALLVGTIGIGGRHKQTSAEPVSVPQVRETLPFSLKCGLDDRRGRLVCYCPTRCMRTWAVIRKASFTATSQDEGAAPTSKTSSTRGGHNGPNQTNISAVISVPRVPSPEQALRIPGGSVSSSEVRFQTQDSTLGSSGAVAFESIRGQGFMLPETH